jgi:uncharacterized membrane protein
MKFTSWMTSIASSFYLILTHDTGSCFLPSKHEVLSSIASIRRKGREGGKKGRKAGKGGRKEREEGREKEGEKERKMTVSFQNTF